MGRAAARFRAHGRRKVRLRVVVFHPRAGWQREAEVVDIALGGACIALNEPLAEGDRVTISFIAPTLWDPLAMTAQIVWTGAGTRLEPARAGVIFESKNAAAMFALFELIATIEPSR